MQSYKADSKVTGQSAKSYQEFLKSGKMSKYRQLIIQVLEQGNATRRVLTEKVKAKHPSNLCAPLKILENQGIIKVIDYVRDHVTDRDVSLYGVCQRPEAVELPIISISNLGTYNTPPHFVSDDEKSAI